MTGVFKLEVFIPAPAEAETGRESLLNHLSRSPDDPFSQGTELNSMRAIRETF